jgi:predicted TPR repeat methyltransferase
VLRGGGRFVFSIETTDAADHELAESRRYRHSLAYVARLAAEHGFVADSFEPCVLRRDGGADVAGSVVLLRRPAAP